MFLQFRAHNVQFTHWEVMSFIQWKSHICISLHCICTRLHQQKLELTWFPEVAGGKKKTEPPHHTFSSETAASYHPLHLCPTGNEYNKPDITKVYGSLQSAWTLLQSVSTLRKQYWLKIKRNETLQILIPSAFSTKTKLLRHPKK